MARARRYRRLAKPGRSRASVLADRRARPAQWPATAATKSRDLFGFLALVEQRRHLAEAARAAFGDRVQHERLAPGAVSRCHRRRARRGSGRCARPS